MTDPDEGVNSEVEFTLSPEADAFFYLVPVGTQSTELHSNHVLDREAMDLYVIELFAVDRGNPRQFGETNITLIVTV